MTKRRLWLLPLEPLEERYTGAWYRWLPESFGDQFSVMTIEGQPLAEAIEEGAFLDINSTLHYKATQLQEVARRFYRREVQNGDVFWLSDIEFWGMESIRYLARLQGIEVKIYGFLHAGSYIDCDYMAPMADIGRWVEPAWVAACDKVFLGTEFHKELFSVERLDHYTAHHLQDRLVVTGNPWRTDEARQLGGPLNHGPRDIDVLFPHRPDAEKQPGLFADYVASMAPRYRVVCTTGRAQYRSTNDPGGVGRIMQLVGDGRLEVRVGLDRQAFFQTCRQAKVVVSTALEETFGYAMVEAMAQGALPLMPNRLSYPELVGNDERFLYDNDRDFFRKLNSLIAYAEQYPVDACADIMRYVRRLDGAEQRIMEEMK